MASTEALGRRIGRIRSGTGQTDYVLLIAVAALLLFGMVMVFSTTFDWSYQETSNPLSIFWRQVLWVGLGVLGMFALSRVDYMWWRWLAVPLMGLALALLILVLIFGSVNFGAQRTFFNGSLQPSEPAKLAIIIYIAAWLSSKGAKVRQVTYGLIPFGVLIGLIASLIVLQPDFGTAILIVLTSAAMFFIAGADLLQLGIGCLVATGTFYVLISKSTHGATRVSQFLEAWKDPSATSHHVQQALVALGSGGLFGRGLGVSYQKFGYLPAPHTDSVFAVLGEELGLAGCLIVVALFALVAQRGFKIAQEARDPFGAVLAAGLTCWLIFQALINIAVVIGIIPFTGIPLPFLSLGGSAMVSALLAVGLLLSVSRGSQAAIASRPAQKPVTASSQMREAQNSFGVRSGGSNRARIVLRRRHRRPRISRVGRR
jgi:cell division protein FtsW